MQAIIQPDLFRRNLSQQTLYSMKVYANKAENVPDCTEIAASIGGGNHSDVGNGSH